ncbi:hypothetical protein D3C78_936060 [compost metagenome]
MTAEATPQVVPSLLRVTSVHSSLSLHSYLLVLQGELLFPPADLHGMQLEKNPLYDEWNETSYIEVAAPFVPTVRL